MSPSSQRNLSRALTDALVEGVFRPGLEDGAVLGVGRGGHKSGTWRNFLYNQFTLAKLYYIIIKEILDTYTQESLLSLLMTKEKSILQN